MTVQLHSATWCHTWEAKSNICNSKAIFFITLSERELPSLKTPSGKFINFTVLGVKVTVQKLGHEVKRSKILKFEN